MLGGVVLGLFPVRPHFCRGGKGQQKVCSPISWSPRGHGLHPYFVVAEIWADRGVKGGGLGGVKGG